MSFALNTFIIFFLFVLPGIIFRRGYYSKTFSKQFIKISPFDIFMSSLIPGIIIQLFYTFTVHNLICSIDFQAVINILSSNDKAFRGGASVFIRDINYVFVFFSAQLFLAWIFGRIAKSIIRSGSFDIKWKLFRFRNKWHYILKGEIIRFPENKLEKSINSVDSTIVDALVIVNDKTYIYTGLVSDYHLNDMGIGLEHIELLKVYRKEVSSQNELSINQVIPTDTFLLPYCNAINLNFHYIEDDEQREERERRKQKFYKRLSNVLLIVLILSVIPIFVSFNIQRFSWYTDYKEIGFFAKLFVFLSLNNFLSLFLPVEVDGKYIYHNQWYNILIKGIMSIVFGLLASYLAK